MTYYGIGIIAAPRGSEITIDLFYNWTPMFDELGHPRCGYRTYEFNKDQDSYKCGRYCYQVPYITPNDKAFDKLIWEGASHSGEFRMQFFNSGHFRFVKVR